MHDDLDLLGRFARDGAEDDFAELVRRHLNLVYSAALRQVRSPQLAEEVAQSVFTDLARNAGKLQPGTVLAAWLYQVTRRTAIDVVRQEARRQLREQVAVGMNAMNSTSSDWAQVEPLLDEAMAALDETDRTAVLLRYFENKSLRDVGAALGTSDDTAQKRVSRAVDRLREFFARHGVTVGASALTLAVSANAVQAAPIGLAATISAASMLAGAAVATTATATATTKAIAMTTIQKTIYAVTLAAAVGTGVYETQRASRLQHELAALPARTAEAGQVNQLQQERDAFAKRLAAAQREIEQLQRDAADIHRLRGEVTGLRQQVADNEKLRLGNERLLTGSAIHQPRVSPPSGSIPKGEMSPQSKNTVNNMKQLMLGMKIYAMRHNRQFATSFDQIKEYVGSLTGGGTWDTFEFAPNSERVNESMPNAIVFRERVARQDTNGNWLRVYGFASGLAFEQISTDGNFEAWERQHAPKPK